MLARNVKLKESQWEELQELVSWIVAWTGDTCMSFRLQVTLNPKPYTCGFMELRVYIGPIEGSTTKEPDEEQLHAVLAAG